MVIVIDFGTETFLKLENEMGYVSNSENEGWSILWKQFLLFFCYLQQQKEYFNVNEKKVWWHILEFIYI